MVMVNDPDLPGRWDDQDCTQRHGYLCYQPLSKYIFCIDAFKMDFPICAQEKER